MSSILIIERKDRSTMAKTVKTPESLKDLTKNFMLKDIEDRPKKEIEEFVEKVKTWTKETRNPQTDETIITPDWSRIRKDYANKFYPDLMKKAATKKPAKKAPTLSEKLDHLLENAKD